MPIPVAQFQVARLDEETNGLAGRAVSFLKSNHDLAYSAAELREALLPADASAADVQVLLDMLLLLTAYGALYERVVDGEDYYMFRADLSDVR